MIQSLDRKNRLRLIGWVLFVFLTAVVTLSAVWNPGTRIQKALSTANPQTVLPARITPVQVFAVNAEVSGTVVSVLVSPGTAVAAGQLLALIDSPELRRELERAQERLRFARSRLESTRQAEEGAGKVRNEEDKYASAAWRTAEERLNAFSIAEVEKAYSEAKARHQSTRALLRQQLATQSEVGESEARELVELRNLIAAREHGSRLKQEVETAGSQLRLAQLQREAKGVSQLQMTEMEFQEADSALRALNEKALRQRVTAHRAGTVLEVAVHPGDPLFVGTPILTVGDLARLTFEVSVTPKMARQIEVNRPVTVRVPTEPPKRLAASVSSVVLSPDQAKATYLVRVVIPNPSPETVLAGLDGAVEFPHGER